MKEDVQFLDATNCGNITDLPSDVRNKARPPDLHIQRTPQALGSLCLEPAQFCLLEARTHRLTLDSSWFQTQKTGLLKSWTGPIMNWTPALCPMNQYGSGMVFPLQKRECWVPYKPQKSMKIVEIEGSYTRNIVGTSPLCRNWGWAHQVGQGP